MNPSHQTSPSLFQQHATSRPSFPDDEEDTSENSTPQGPSDLEKAETVDDRAGGTSTGAYRATTSGRVSRIQSLQQRRRIFDHPLSHVKTSVDVVVDFDGPDDPYRPINWPFRKKTVTTALYGLTTFGSTWASSVYSPAVDQISERFAVGTEVALLGLSVLLVGFGLGPLIWAPLSEVYGRKIAVLTPYFLACVFSFATATSKDIQTVIITRFFTGFFGSAPITNTGGVLGDIWSPTTRGTAIVFYAFAVVGGPTLGPVVGGAVVQSYLRWRWTEYLTGIIQITILVLDVLILDESYPPRLLVYKARRLRISTGNWALHAKFEEWDVSLKELAVKFGIRPFQMLMTPICFSVALYASFVYGILYGNLAAFPIEFEGERGWNQFVGTLPFLSLLIGILLGGAANILNNQYYQRRFHANGDKAVPEARLPPMMGGSIVFAAGLFIFGWTSDKTIPWIAPVIGTVLMGFGFFTIFQGALNYLIDTFTRYAASAVAANTFLRSMFAAAFPLFVTPMYHKLGIPWASSVFGFFAVALIPIPFLFFIYGPWLRSRGKYSSNMG
ncbi:MFS transporter, DHA1 family, multidrug resistance protein, partial [Lecanoromycetidae sp. Uapishka_2]